ncbi:PREDICTED: uncharacterized protein LOC106726601 [Myotis brandtii]|uniref:uncharacterized protein LOC106726601 n=1 Tax=Myotis brandtii TaxID=109478 RepID=UPI0007042265|nr:PREDICTED: uncharacterized protein LOC106726601 [Myotis brandtii]
MKAGSGLTGRTIRRLRIRFSIALALKKTLGRSPEKAQQFPLFERVVLRYNRPADSQHVPDEIRSSCRYVFVAALSLYQQILDDSLLAYWHNPGLAGTHLGGLGAGRAAPPEEGRDCQAESQDFCERWQGPLGSLTLQGPAQPQVPGKRSNATENDELGGAVEGGLPLQRAEWYKPGTELGAQRAFLARTLQGSGMTVPPPRKEVLQ